MARQLLQNRTPTAYAGVEAYARKHAGTDAGAMADLVLGYAHILDRDYSRAILPLTRAQAHAGDLGDYVSYYQAVSYGGTGNAEQATATLKDFSNKWNDSIFLRDATEVYGTALVAAGRPAEAVTVLEANRLPARATTEIALGRAYAKFGKADKAAEIFRHLYLTMPVAPEADAAKLELDSIASQTQVTPPTFAERSTRAALLGQANHWGDAAREYRALLNDAPPQERGNVQVALAVAMRRSGGKARDVRQMLEEAQATGDANATRLATLADMARTEDDEDRFLKTLEQLRQAAPTNQQLENTLLSAGNMFLLKNDFDRAIDFYREAAERFPNGPRASYAHWKAAWLSYRQGRKDEARREFSRHVELYPLSSEAPAALYWRARLAEDDKDFGTAKAWYGKVIDRYRNYYYGLLARDRITNLPSIVAGASDPVLDRIPPVQPLKPAAELEDPPPDDVRVQKSKLLENAGMADFAIRELQAASGGTGAHWATAEIARVFEEEGQYHRALQSLKRAIPQYFSLDINALPRSYWEGLFPRPYWTDVKRFSMENRLDPFLVASLIRQESEFNPGAVSRANAWGLMQLLPTVGRSTARELRVRRFSTESLLVPTTNLQLGTRYFRGMVDRFGGQVEYALAAYNAGSNRVDDWMATGKYNDIAEFVESIPFTETREYVQAIMRNAQLYRKLYGTP